MNHGFIKKLYRIIKASLAILYRILKYILLFALLAFALSITYKIYNERPSVNTKEYLDAHGVVKGKENIASIGDVVFKVPAEMNMNVETQGEIIPGQAGVLRLYYDFSHLLSGTQKDTRPKPRVRVEVRHMGVVQHDNWDMTAQLNKWQKIIPRPELELIEFHEKQFDGGWDYISFQAMDGVVVTPLKEALNFGCSGHPEYGIRECWGGVQYLNGIHVWFYFPAKLIPHWKAVYKHVDSGVRSLMVKK